MSSGTPMVSQKDVRHAWFVVDATDQVLGRLAAGVAKVLCGKHRRSWVPYLDTGDFVVVTNCEKVRFTGKKWEQKQYAWYTGYPGQKTITAQARLEKHPELILEEAVRRMLPKNKLGMAMLKKLKLYVGPDHPHQAQQPEPTELASA